MKYVGNKISYVRHPFARNGFFSFGLGLLSLGLAAASIVLSVRGGGQGGMVIGALGFSSNRLWHDGAVVQLPGLSGAGEKLYFRQNRAGPFGRSDDLLGDGSDRWDQRIDDKMTRSGRDRWITDIC